MPYLSRITVYPIKSLDGVDITQGEITTGGALKHDRRFAIFDFLGRYINGKNNAAIHQVRSTFDLEADMITLTHSDSLESTSFNLNQDIPALTTWLSAYFKTPTQLRENLTHGFPDDSKASGPTVVSQASLDSVSSWFPGLDSPEIAKRMRANLEITDAAAFWEDCLFGAKDAPREFAIGDVKFLGTNPCSRCIVPTRDSQTGKAYSQFQKVFSQQRRETLAEGVERSPFNHFYRFTVNTIIPASESGKVLHLGDEIKLL
jgi:uncharacterized protein